MNARRSFAPDLLLLCVSIVAGPCPRRPLPLPPAATRGHASSRSCSSSGSRAAKNQDQPKLEIPCGGHPGDSHGLPELRPLLLLVWHRQIRSEWVAGDRIHAHPVSSIAPHRLKPVAVVASMSRASSLRLARQPMR